MLNFFTISLTYFIIANYWLPVPCGGIFCVSDVITQYFIVTLFIP